MKKLAAIAAALMAATGIAPAAQADVLSMVGDSDCFGLGGTCPAGTLWRDQLGGVFFSSNATPGDGAFTDRWFAETTPTFSLGYSGGTNVSLELKIAGIADLGRGPWTVTFNGTNVGTITTNNTANAFQEVRLFNFAIAANLLQATNTVFFTTNGGDGYSIDYVSLLGTRAQGAVPEPATWAMMMGGLGAIGFGLRRRHRTVAAVA